MILPHLPTLYKIGARGQVLEWSVHLEGTTLVITHGQQDGSLQESRERVEEGKNLGRANSTTAGEQAALQAESRWKKQIDRHYRETIEDAQKAARASTNPMLAHKYADRAHKLEAGQLIAVQPKLDGMRCLARKEDGEVRLLSRGGKDITSAPNVVSELRDWMQDGETWDGELYNHDLEFEVLMSIARKKEPDPRHNLLQFHVFDVVSSENYLDRISVIEDRLDGRNGELIQLVDTALLKYDEREVEKWVELAEIDGFEGIIMRRLDLPYEHKRSEQLLKVKTFHDEEFEIVGSEDGKKGSRKEGLLTCFVLKADGSDETFKAALMGSEDTLRDLWLRRDDYVGEMATCVFQEKTKYGIPRFPKVKAIRGWEDLS